MNTDGTGFNTCKECHKTESLINHTTTNQKEREQLEDRRNGGESSCNFGDGTDQRVQSLMFMMMIMMKGLGRKRSRSDVTYYSVYLNINQLDALNFYNEFISCFYMFRAHVLIIRRSKLYYTTSGIITPTGGRPVHRLREMRTLLTCARDGHL